MNVSRYNSALRHTVLVLAVTVGSIAGVAGRVLCQPLTLVVSSAKGQYVLGEPVVLTVTRNNPAVNSVDVITELNPYIGDLRVDISSRENQFKHYVGPQWDTIDVDGRPRTLKGSGEERAQVSVLWNRPVVGVDDYLQTNFAFSEPGEYQLRARLLDTPSALLSNVLTIRVLEPVGTDAEVWTFLKQYPDVARFVQYPAAPLPAARLQELRALVAANPGASQAPSIRDALATLESRPR